MEDAMTTFRKTLMATTVLAGFAIFALDAAQAGPNGGPSLGSISGFSSMRMDFNRVGGPNRALSRDDTRVVPITVKTTEKSEKSDKGAPKKDAAKKGINTARVSNPKSVTGGKGKESVSGEQNLHIPAALAEIYRITGGNLDDLAEIAALADQIKTGPLVVADPLFPAQGGGTFTPPEFPGGPKGDEQSDRNFLDGWAGYSTAPGGPDTSKTGWAAGDAWAMVSHSSNGTTSRTVHYNKDTDTYWIRTVTETFDSEGGQGGTTTTRNVDVGPAGGSVWTIKTHYDADGNILSSTSSIRDIEGTATDITDEEPSEKEGAEKQQAENEKDSQPVEEGTGRPGRSGWCSPTGGCVIASPIPPRRIIPTEESGTPEARRQSPSWATDPSEEGYTGGGGGGGYHGYRPQDEEGGGIGGPGNPELSALNAPL
jgi:hypothetical protein